jgi:poly(glycerol-phosphate) alpha-glucosyltransferase
MKSMFSDRTPAGSAESGDGPVTVMFLNRNIKKKRTGIENSALARVRVFEQYLGIVPQVLTITYDPRFAETRAELLRAGKITQNIVFRNLYDDFQEMPIAREESASHEPPFNERWKRVDVTGTPDARFYDEKGELVMYRKCSRETGFPRFINFFHKKRKWRRDTYAEQGYLSRVQYLDLNTGKALYENYLRPDGTVAIIQLYTIEDGRRRLSKISLMNRQGNCIDEFTSLEEFTTHWLNRITQNPAQQYVMVSDKNRFYYRSLQKLQNSQAKHNVFVVPIIHSVHTENTFDVKGSKTNLNYVDIFEDISAPDAIVVGTNRQRQDIMDRYGVSNIRVIPHAYNEMSDFANPAFEEREQAKVVSVGRYCQGKNQAAAVRTFRHVVDALPKATLHFYGSGSGKLALQEQVRQLGLEHSIFINDYADDVSAIFRSAGLSLLTSNREGYPLVIMESLGHGCPVVAFDINYGPSDMIQDGETGALVPFGEEEALAKKIIEILSSPERHRRLSENAGRSTGESGAEFVAKEWQRLIGELVPGFNATRNNG